MKNIFFAVSLTTLFFSVSIFPQTAPSTNDFQIWHETSVVFPLVKARNKKDKEFDRLTFFLSGVLRFSSNSSGFFDERIDFGFSYRLNKYLSFTPEYLYRGIQLTHSNHQFEHQIRFAVAPENRWKKVALIDRNQIEYRIRHSRPDSVRYRNRLRFEYSILKNKKGFFTPFVSTEPFYDFSVKKFARNELFAGINKKFSKTFAADFFYLFVKDINSPKTINGFGINLRFRADWSKSKSK